MIYIKDGHKDDMYFVCEDSIDKRQLGDYDILKVFFNRKNAAKYMDDLKTQRLGLPRG